MVFVKHLSSSMCLSEGPGGNHQPRWARVWRSNQLERPEIRVFWQRLWRVLVKQAVGAGLWLWYRGACLPSVVCKRLFRWGWCCDNKLTLWPWIDPGVSWGSSAFLIHSVWLWIAQRDKLQFPKNEVQRTPKRGLRSVKGISRNKVLWAKSFVVVVVDFITNNTYKWAKKNCLKYVRGKLHLLPFIKFCY